MTEHQVVSFKVTVTTATHATSFRTQTFSLSVLSTLDSDMNNDYPMAHAQPTTLAMVRESAKAAF